MYKSILFVSLVLCSYILRAQDKEKDENENRGFKKENLFTGGSIALSFFDNSFLIGGSPVVGYSLTRWADIGLVGNYNYTSYRDYQFIDDKLKQSIYGGGVFTRLFPVRFIFAQAQIERNWIKQKYIPAPNAPGSYETWRGAANSFLVGAGYTTGRDPDGGSMFGYLSVMFDVLKNTNSPYTYINSQGRSVSLPVIRAGVNIPLFQGSRRSY